MRTCHSWRFVKLLTASAVLVLSAQVLVSVLSREPLKMTPLSEQEHELLSPQSYRYVLNRPACGAAGPLLLLVVPVAPQDAAAREAIRKTWGAPSQDTLTVFFMGVPEGGQGSSLQDQLEEESREHADIIQMNFLDSYQNLTIKTVMIMNWAATHCPTASYVMKVDSDIFVNVFHLLRWLKSCPRQAFITGSVISDGRPRRDSDSKWFVSKDQFPEDRFPPYVSGAGYVLSADLAARIPGASRFVRMVSMEDVYVGLCLRVLGVRPAYAFSLPTLRNLFEIRDLEYDRCTFAKLLIANGFKAPKLLQVWPDFSKGQSSC